MWEPCNACIDYLFVLIVAGFYKHYFKCFLLIPISVFLDSLRLVDGCLQKKIYVNISLYQGDSRGYRR